MMMIFAGIASDHHDNEEDDEHLSIEGYGAGYKGEVMTRLGRAEFSSTAGGHGPPMGHASTMDGESGVLASGKEEWCC